MKNLKKSIAGFLAVLVLLTGCASGGDSESNATSTAEVETTAEINSEMTSSLASQASTETETEDKTERETENKTEADTAESKEKASTTEADIETEISSEEMTTAFVEEGETNENGIVDGQNTGVVETVSAISNATELTSALPYLIKVNRYANCVTIYAKDNAGKFTVPVKTMVCSCGRAGYETPLGTFQLKERYAWRRLYGNVYGYYSTRIQGSILFHSVPYIKASPNTLENWEYDKLGAGASLGCIRLQVQDSKWIFENCAAGTYVIIYDSADPGPLGKPQARKIGNAYGIYSGWDPTDPTPGNPWMICNSTVYTASNKQYTFSVGTEVNLLEQVGSYTAYGEPAKITVTGSINKNLAGAYNIIYSVTDDVGRTYAIQRTFNIVEGNMETKAETTTAKETETIISGETTGDEKITETESEAEEESTTLESSEDIPETEETIETVTEPKTDQEPITSTTENLTESLTESQEEISSEEIVEESTGIAIEQESEQLFIDEDNK